jgi:hypothetical protein
MHDSQDVLGDPLTPRRNDGSTEYGGYAGDNRRRPDGTYRTLSAGEQAAGIRRAGMRDEPGPAYGDRVAL